jgi:hypothetical protein
MRHREIYRHGRWRELEPGNVIERVAVIEA